jgi:FeS cluster assembly scaffold protein NifU
MKSTQYTKKVMEHFRNPQNVGTLEGSDVAVGRVGNPVCGDLMEIYIRVKDDKIDDIKFRTFGCGSAIATSSMITEMVRGKTLDEAMKVTRQDVANELEGLPPIKMHCSNLAADALHAAIANWRGEQSPDMTSKPVLSEIDAGEAQTALIQGENEFLGKGYYVYVDDLTKFKDQRVLVVNTGNKAIETALTLTEHTGRVILLNSGKKIQATSELKIKLDRSNVKVINESKLLKLLGMHDVEKILVHNLDEDEKYELFVDVVINLALDNALPACGVAKL